MSRAGDVVVVTTISTELYELYDQLGLQAAIDMIADVNTLEKGLSAASQVK